MRLPRNVKPLFIMLALSVAALGVGNALAAPAAQNVTGNWAVKIVVPGVETAHASAKLSQSGADITGTITYKGHTSHLTGTVVGSTITLKFSFSGMDVTATGTLNSSFTKVVKGTYVTSSGIKGTWTAVKKK